MRLQITPLLLLTIMALGAAIPVLFGTTPPALFAAGAVVAVGALLSGTGLHFTPGSLRNLQRGGLTTHQIAEQYEQAREAMLQIQQDLKAHAKGIEQSTSGVTARLQAVEQVVAKLDAEGIGLPGAVGPTLASQAIEAFQGDQAAAFEHLKAWNQGTARVQLPGKGLRASLTNEDGSPSEGGEMPSQPSRGGIRGPVLRPLRLLDVLRTVPVTADSHTFVQLNATGDAGEQHKEGDEKADIEFDGELKKIEIGTFAGFTTASRQVLADQSQLQANIDRVLRHKTWSLLEHRIINGGKDSNNASRVIGLIEQSVPFVPGIGGPVPDQIGEAATGMIESGYQPGFVIMNAFDWHRIAVSKDKDEGYLFGSPSAPIAPGLWNLPVVRTPSLGQGLALVVDPQHVAVLDREQPSVMVSNSHSDYFTRNLVAILAELRAGLMVEDLLAVTRVQLDFDTSGT